MATADIGWDDGGWDGRDGNDRTGAGEIGKRWATTDGTMGAEETGEIALASSKATGLEGDGSDGRDGGDGSDWSGRAGGRAEGRLRVDVLLLYIYIYNYNLKKMAKKTCISNRNVV